MSPKTHSNIFTTIFSKRAAWTTPPSQWRAPSSPMRCVPPVHPWVQYSLGMYRTTNAHTYIRALHVHHMQCTCVSVAVCVCQYVTKNYCLLPLPTNHRRCVYAYAKKISNALRLRPPYLQDIVYWNLIDYSSNNFLYPKKESNKKVSKLKIELKPNDVLFCSSLPKNKNDNKNKTKTIRLLNEYEI